MDLVHHHSPTPYTACSISCKFFQVSWQLQHVANRKHITRQGKACLTSFTPSHLHPLRVVKSLSLHDNRSGCLIGALLSIVARPSIASRRLLLSIATRAASDPELHAVLELASETELYELSDILYGPSLLSPLLKSVTSGDGLHLDNISESYLGERGRERAAILNKLESRFFFLAADAKATLSGRRPVYRDVLLLVRKKLNVQCAQNLASEDMEAEIFLHLLRQYSRSDSFRQASQNKLGASYMNDIGTARAGKWHGYSLATLRLSIDELCTVLLKVSPTINLSFL